MNAEFTLSIDLSSFANLADVQEEVGFILSNLGFLIQNGRNMKRTLRTYNGKPVGRTDLIPYVSGGLRAEGE